VEAPFAVIVRANEEFHERALLASGNCADTLNTAEIRDHNECVAIISFTQSEFKKTLKTVIHIRKSKSQQTNPDGIMCQFLDCAGASDSQLDSIKERRMRDRNLR
jgi:hypothetical protein